MRMYKFQWRYRTPPHSYEAGDTASLDDGLAEWINNDSPGVLVVIDDEKYGEPVVRTAENNRMVAEVPNTLEKGPHISGKAIRPSKPKQK